MRGESSKQASMLFLKSPESLVPQEHPIRAVKALVDAALREMSGDLDKMYSGTGRASIPPEWLLKSSLLMALYSVRSERMFCEQLGYNMLFRWFLDMEMTEAPFDHSTFSKNRERLMKHDVAQAFFRRVVEQARDAHLMSTEHFTVDGTLIDAWASLKSFQAKEDERKERNAKKRARKERRGGGPKGGGSNPDVSFHGEKRSNQTHESTTDPEARLARKGEGKEAKLSFSANALMENRHGLLVDFRVAEATGTAEREQALLMLVDNNPNTGQITVGADKGYDAKEFVEQCRLYGITPHIAQNTSRKSAVDDRTTRHPGYAISQRIRKRVEEIFGWAKTVGGFRKTRYRGVARTQLAAYFVGAAYNLVRMARLLTAPA